MGLLDSVVNNAFRDAEAGRIVVFSGDRRNRGYLVRSASDEQKIKSFLKMFYLAQLSILLLGMLVSNVWANFIIHLQEFGRPIEHLPKVALVYMGIYSLVVLLPYFFVWRAYKKSLLFMVSPQDEVLVSGKIPAPQLRIAGLGLITLGLLFFFAAFIFLTHHK
jgi:hypothetical protein